MIYFVVSSRHTYQLKHKCYVIFKPDYVLIFIFMNLLKHSSSLMASGLKSAAHRAGFIITACLKQCVWICVHLRVLVLCGRVCVREIIYLIFEELDLSSYRTQEFGLLQQIKATAFSTF